jgi:type I restriction enzyme S subunit
MKNNTLQTNIPSGWKQVTLGDLVSVTTGSRDANHGSPDGQYPFFTCAQKVSRINDFSFDTEAVLIAGNGDFNVKYYSGKFDAYQRTYVLSDFKNTTGQFVYQKAKQALNDIMRNNQGSSVKFIKMGDLTDYELITPPIKEQQKIADILGTVDEYIAKTQELVDATEKLKRGLMQQLFTRGIRNAEFKVSKLGNLCIFKTGKLNSNKAVDGGVYPFFTCSQETFAINQYSFDQKAILLAGNNAAGKYSVKYYDGKFDAYQRTYVISIKNEDH